MSLSFIRSPTPLHEDLTHMTSFNLNYLPRAQFSNTITLGVRVSIYEF